MARLERRREELERDLAAQNAPMVVLRPNLAELYRRRVADLHEALNEEGARADAFEIIRSLVDAIVLVPDGGTLRVNLKGELAGILALSLDGSLETKKPGTVSGTGLAEQVKVVAGTRCQRNRNKLCVEV